MPVRGYFFYHCVGYWTGGVLYGLLIHLHFHGKTFCQWSTFRFTFLVTFILDRRNKKWSVNLKKRSGKYKGHIYHLYSIIRLTVVDALAIELRIELPDLTSTVTAIYYVYQILPFKNFWFFKLGLEMLLFLSCRWLIL